MLLWFVCNGFVNIGKIWIKNNVSKDGNKKENKTKGNNKNKIRIRKSPEDAPFLVIKIERQGHIVSFEPQNVFKKNSDILYRRRC